MILKLQIEKTGNMKIFKVDLDYESYLFDLKYDENSSQNQKIIKEFEYIFFLANKDDCILKNLKNYDKNYLQSLKDLGFVIPALNPEAKSFQFWWGNRHNFEIEKKLNSKLTSAQVAKEKNWGFERGAIVSSFKEIEEHVSRFPETKKWILKHPNSFSGIGHAQFESADIHQNMKLKTINESFLLEPLQNRIFDIGTTFEIENSIIKRQFMVQNFNSPAGRFRGGAACVNVEKFKRYILYKYNYNIEPLFKTTQDIASEYLKLGATSNIQIDSFIHEEEEELKLYALVEVNYRKTMGLVLQSLADKYPEADFIEWKIFSSKELKEENLSEDWIKISPEGNNFQSYFRLMYFS